MRGRTRRIGCVVSLERERRRTAERGTTERSGVVGFDMGVHGHQRKLFPCRCSGGFLLCGAGCAGVAPRASGRAGFAGRRGELPAVSFWKDEVFSSLPEKFCVTRQARGRRLSSHVPNPAGASSACGVTDASDPRKRFLTMHECGAKENPWLTPTQCSIKKWFKD